LIAIDIKLAPPHAQFRVLMRMVAERLQRAASGAVAWRFFPGLCASAFACWSW